MNVPLLKKNDTFNLFVLKLLNVANLYIFKCKRAAKVENGGGEYLFVDELGSFFGVN